MVEIEDSNGNNDVVFKRNDVGKITLTATDLKTEPNIHLVSQGQVKSNIYNSNGDNDAVFYIYGTEYFNLSIVSTIPSIVCATGVDFVNQRHIKCNIYNSNGNNDVYLKKMLIIYN